MSIEWVNRAIDDLRAWGREKDVEVDVDEVRLLCDYASDYLRVNRLADFQPETFDELLLEIYPRKVIAPPETAQETVAAARTLVDFLEDRGEVGDDVAAWMRAAIDEIEPALPAALADTSKFGMAKSLFSAIGPESLDAPPEPSAQGPAVESEAGVLIAGLITEAVSEETAQREIGRWLSERSAAQAAAELLAAVVGAPAEVRGVAVTIVDRLGLDAAPVVRSYLDDTELRPHAIHWLSSRGLDAPVLTQEELLWVSVDMLALALPAAAADPDGFAENIGASAPSRRTIEEMWRVDHPDVVDVLELLGNTLRDRMSAKAARKAAFKARSRGLSD